MLATWQRWLKLMQVLRTRVIQKYIPPIKCKRCKAFEETWIRASRRRLRASEFNRRKLIHWNSIYDSRLKCGKYDIFLERMIKAINGLITRIISEKDPDWEQTINSSQLEKPVSSQRSERRVFDQLGKVCIKLNTESRK